MSYKKILVFGGTDCGRHSLLLDFSMNYFPHTSRVLIIKHRSQGEIKKEKSALETKNAQNGNGMMHANHKIDVVLMCFAIDSPDCLETIVAKWLPEMEYFSLNIPIILVGTKIDLRTNPDESKKLVTTAEGRALADRIKAFSYVECSFKTKEGIRTVFEEAARATM